MGNFACSQMLGFSGGCDLKKKKKKNDTFAHTFAAMYQRLSVLPGTGY
jgi:hypothetical protein